MTPLRILVCVKQVVDPELPASSLRLDADGRAVSAGGAPPVVNPYDANALKAAIDLRREAPAEVTVLSAGAGLSRAVLSRALAAGADRVVALRTERNARGPEDSLEVAALLAALVRRAGAFDLVLTGRQASDTNAGTTGAGLAARLDVPFISLVVGVRRAEGRELIVERLDGDGTEILACPLPAVLAVSHEIGDLPPTSLRDLIAAKKKPFDWVDADALSPADTCAPPAVELVSLEKPDRERPCRLLTAETAARAGALLARSLLDDGCLAAPARPNPLPTSRNGPPVGPQSA